MANDTDINADVTQGENVVYLYTESYGGRITAIFISSASQTHSVQILGSPGEKGMTRFDHRVRMPTVVSIRGAVTNENYEVLRTIAATQKASQLRYAFFKFYGRDGEAVENLVLTKFTHEATSDRLNMVNVSLELTEFILA